MTPSCTTRTTLAITSPTAREPVADGEHPLSGSSSPSSSPDGFSYVDPPSNGTRGEPIWKDKCFNDDQDGGSERPKCSHCRNSKCHELAKVSPFKGACALLEVTDFAKARAIAKQAVALFKEHPTGPFLEVMAGVCGQME
jgi:hypothetical protein